MWFLEADIALRLLGGCLIWAILSMLARRFWSQSRLDRFLVILDLALIAYVSEWLAVFYALYTVLTYGIASLAGRGGGRGRNPLFVFCCLLCAVPFFYLRMRELFPELPLLFALTGLAYNMLKAVDAVYYVYYTGEKLDFLHYANYMLFFPVITAGPILRYRDFSRSLAQPEAVSGESLTRDFKRLIRGYFKKVVLIVLVTAVLARLTALDPRPWLSVIVCLFSYLMLWLDMSGYADIAIAMGGFLGLKVPENFKSPLKAASFTQFWRNWHVSLTDWIREHIFVVLNGKRLNRVQGAAMGFGTMMVMGLWHGFSLTFVLDGLMNGSLLAIEHLLGITTVKRGANRYYLLLRRCIVTLVFSFTTIFYTLDQTQLAAVLHGFVNI